MSGSLGGVEVRSTNLRVITFGKKFKGHELAAGWGLELEWLGLGGTVDGSEIRDSPVNMVNSIPLFTAFQHHPRW